MVRMYFTFTRYEKSNPKQEWEPQRSYITKTLGFIERLCSSFRVNAFGFTTGKGILPFFTFIQTTTKLISCCLKTTFNVLENALEEVIC